MSVTIENAYRSILSVTRKDENVELTPLTRVNEQQTYAALVLEGLRMEYPDKADKFIDEFQKHHENFVEKDPEHAVFRAAKKSLRSFRRMLGMRKRDLRELRHRALSGAQFDSLRHKLSIKREEGADDGTAVRALKTALKFIEESVPLTDGELKLFNQLNRSNRVKVGG